MTRKVTHDNHFFYPLVISYNHWKLHLFLVDDDLPINFDGHFPLRKRVSTSNRRVLARQGPVVGRKKGGTAQHCGLRWNSAGIAPKRPACC